MLANKIADYETQTHNVLSHQGKIVGGTEGDIEVFDVKPGHSSHYYKENTNKRRIMLHFTMGFLGGDISTLTKENNKVSVSFIVARSGRIYRLFPTEKWSYHVGPGTVGGNPTISKSSIGIEISNIGPLEESGNGMWNAYGSRYCNTSEAQYFQTLPSAYRGYRSFATFTPEQYSATLKLITHLCEKHTIPNTFLPTSRRYSVFGSPADAQSFRGVCSHVNYRATGKVDIGPAFDWTSVGA